MYDDGSIPAASTRLFTALTSSAGHHLTPCAILSIDGKPFGTDALSRIISLELTDKRGFEADDLTLSLSDIDGALAIPPMHAEIKVFLGYVETGVVDKGTYKLAEFTAAGSPDTLSLTAHAADMAETLAESRDQSYHRTTLAAIVAAIAKRHGYETRIAAQYEKITIAHIDQTSESDASFLSRLAADYDAIATVKYGCLIFCPAGTATTASGQPLPPIAITRASGDNHSFTYSATNAYNAVRAYYTESGTGKKSEVIINKDNVIPVKTEQKTRRGKSKKTAAPRTVDTSGAKIKTLRHLYTSAARAAQGARAAFTKIQRGAATLSINLATGRADVCPETPVTVKGFKPEIDNLPWIITECRHSLSDGGYTASLSLEAMPDVEEDLTNQV